MLVYRKFAQKLTEFSTQIAQNKPLPKWRKIAQSGQPGRR
jgi:hypothetical protein